MTGPEKLLIGLTKNNKSKKQMAIFKNKFLSKAGQKERLTNVVKTINAAFNPLSKDKVIANTPSKTANKVLETVANHPYVTAGIVAGGITAAKNIPQMAVAVKGSAATTTGAYSIGKTAIATGLGGLALGSLLSGGGKATTGDQITKPQQFPSINPQPKQDTNQNPTINPNQTGGNPFNLSGNDNYVLYNYRQSQDTTSNYTAYALPNQVTPSNLTASQETTPSQSATSESGTNWLTIAAIAAGAYILLKE